MKLSSTSILPRVLFVLTLFVVSSGAAYAWVESGGKPFELVEQQLNQVAENIRARLVNPDFLSFSGGVRQQAVVSEQEREGERTTEQIGAGTVSDSEVSLGQATAASTPSPTLQSTSTPVPSPQTLSPQVTNASQLLGATWANPAEIGSGTPNSAVFSNVTANGALAVNGSVTMSEFVNGFLLANGIGEMSATRVSLSNSSHVADRLPTASGGTGNDFSGAAAGSVLSFGATGQMTVVSPGTSGYVLTSNGAGALPTWTSVGSATVDWANPGSIGSSTPNTGDFTALSLSGASTPLSVGSGSQLQVDDNGRMTLTYVGDSGFLSSSGGVIFINNTSNTGTGIGIYSNAGADAQGNMINVKVDNPAYSQAAFYMNYDGSSNAVEIVNNGNDSSSNALAVTGNNILDSTVGIIGYELDRGTIKVTHNRPGSGTDSSASGLSIDLKGVGTRAQGVYVDSTEVGGTLGNLLRLRNESVDKFVVGPQGNVTIAGNVTQGASGTDTTFTKQGNNSADQFFVGTNGAFRVQRSATDSEAFRVQVSGDIQGRWLGTSDGKLKWGPGNATQDVVLRRSAAGVLTLEGSLVADGTISGSFAGTVTPTGFTAGSVVFAGTGGTLNQDNSNLFWDDSANRLGVGNSSPGALLAVGSTAPFLVDSSGNVTQGVNGTNTSFTKNGNTAGDEFFVGTSGAFRVTRSLSGSEAFRVQVSGDTQGRWLGTSDGQLKWGPGNVTQDTVLRRNSAGVLALEGAILINNLNQSLNTVVKGVSDSNLLYVDAANDRVGIGLSSPAAKLHSLATTEQLRLSYDGSNYAAFTVNSVGDLQLSPSGADVAIGQAPDTGTPLVVSGTNNGGLKVIRITNTGASNNTQAGLSLYTGTTEYARIVANRDSSSAGTLSFSTLQSSTLTEVLRISSSLQPLVQLQGLAGSNGSPGYSFTGDSDTGMYQNGADALAFSTGGTRRMNVSSTGVAVDVVARFLDGNASAPGLTFDNDTNTGIYRATTDTLGFSTAGTERVRIDANGLVGIGNSPSARLDIFSASTNSDVLRLVASDGSRLGRFTETSGGHGWFEVDNASGTAVALLRADGGNSYVSTGLFGIGTTSPAGKLEVNGGNGGNASVIINQTLSGDILTASASGTTRMVLTNSGYLGLGTNLPSYKVDTVEDVNTSAGGRFRNTSTGTFGAAAVGVGANNHAGALVAFGSGYTGGGVLSHFAGRTALITDITNPSEGVDILSAKNTGDIRMYTGGFATSNERLRITSDGLVGIGRTPTTYRLEVNGAMATTSEGDIFAQYDGDSATFYPVFARYWDSHGTFPSSTFIFGNGTNAVVGIEKPGENNISEFRVRSDVTNILGDLNVTGSCTGCSSDERLKKNILQMNGSALQKLLSLRGVTYEWSDAQKEQSFPGLQIGVVAQDVEKVFPELVGTDSRGYKFVRYDKLIAPTIEAIREQQSQISSLDSRVASINGTVTQSVANAFSWTDNAWNVLTEMVFTKAVAFRDRVTFTAATVFKGRAQFDQPIAQSKDAAGSVVLPSGAQSVEVKFAAAYDQAPFVTLTPVGKGVVGYYVDQVTPQGFVLKIEQALSQDVLFNWAATQTTQGAVMGVSSSGSPAVSAQPSPVPSPAVSPTPVASPQPSASPSPSPVVTASPFGEPSASPSSSPPATVSPEPSASPEPSPSPSPTSQP